MRFGWVFAALACALSCPLGGCLSGQTGSPDCAFAISCVCYPLYGAGTLLRVHVEAVEVGKLEAVVDEVYSTAFGQSSVVAGDRVGGALTREPPCGADMPSGLQVGNELLVLYNAGSLQGAVQLLDGVFSWAVPWQDTLSFGDSLELSSSELSVLATVDSCEERFPPPPMPPCNDTQTGLACSAAAPSKSGSVGYAALLLGLAAFVAGVRRRAKP